MKKGTGSVPAEFRGSAARFSRGASRLFQRTLSTLVCLSLTVLVAAQDESPAPPAPAPRAEVSTQEWNFGVAWQGQPLKQDVVVKNVGTATLEITDVSSTCGCTVPTRPKSPLAPGESSTMSISYDSARRVGKANHTVTLITNDPTQRSIPIKLFGEVKPLYEVEPKEGLTFGQLYQKSSETREVTIVNRYTEPLRLQLKAGQDFGPFDIALQELDAGQRYRLTAATRPPLKVDRYQAMVALSTGFELVPEVKVSLYGFVQPPASVRPNKLFLPRNSVSEMKRVLHLTFAPDYPLELTSVRATHDAIRVEAEKVSVTGDARGASGTPIYQITVTLPPGEQIPPDSEPEVEITTNARDPEYQRFVVPIRLVPPRGSPTRPAPTP